MVINVYHLPQPKVISSRILFGEASRNFWHNFTYFPRCMEKGKQSEEVKTPATLVV